MSTTLPTDQQSGPQPRLVLSHSAAEDLKFRGEGLDFLGAILYENHEIHVFRPHTENGPTANGENGQLLDAAYNLADVERLRGYGAVEYGFTELYGELVLIFSNPAD